MRTIKASEFYEQAAKFAEVARTEPILVTVSGKPSVVLIPAEDYDRLKRYEARATKAVRTVDLADSIIARARTANLSHLRAKKR